MLHAALQSLTSSHASDQSCNRSCVQEARAKAKAEAAKKTIKQSNKQVIKLDQKRFTFDPKKHSQGGLHCPFAKINEIFIPNQHTPSLTPSLDDHFLTPNALADKGKLHDVCSRSVLKILWCSRTAIPGIYWAVISLAREVSRWAIVCDKRLLICRLSQMVLISFDAISCGKLSYGLCYVLLG